MGYPSREDEAMSAHTSNRNRRRPRYGRTAPIALALLLGAWAATPVIGHDPAPEASEAEDAEITAWRDRYLALGEDVYDWACAACHATGEKDAPRIGDRSAWSDRSPLWSAVLLEHAKEGYLEMPAKGGHGYLSDRAVEAAGEYMLGVTFPEKPRD
jgi:cytochrome c5